mmetsp:Transcript_38171/g.49396  ORF Transcript_38171/g.49396 Transcript_38171/m.49396 type:complete len:453 (-) Transcript_38171:2219-3577(-)
MSSYPLIANVAQKIERNQDNNGIGGWIAANGTIFTSQIDGKGLYWAQSTELTDDYGLHWHVVLVEQVSCEVGYYILNKEQIFTTNNNEEGGGGGGTRVVCDACPRGAECVGGNHLPFPKSGSWSDLDTSTTKLTFHTCATESCKGFRSQMKKRHQNQESSSNQNQDDQNDQEDNEYFNSLLDLCFVVNSNENNKNASKICEVDSLQCNKGSTGPLCGSCLDHYRFTPMTDTCITCETNPWIAFIAIFILLGILLIIILIKVFIGIHIPEMIWESWFIMIGRHLFKTGSLKVLISTYQIIQSVTYSLNINYPKIFSISLRLLSFLAFDFPGMECNGIGVYDRVYVSSITPMIVAIIIYLSGEFRIYYTKKHHHHLLKELNNNNNGTNNNNNDVNNNPESPSHKKNKKNRIDDAYSLKKKCNKIKSQHAWSLLFLSYLVLPPITGKQLKSLDAY